MRDLGTCVHVQQNFAFINEKLNAAKIYSHRSKHMSLNFYKHVQTLRKLLNNVWPSPEKMIK